MRLTLVLTFKPPAKDSQTMICLSCGGWLFCKYADEMYKARNDTVEAACGEMELVCVTPL